MHVYKFNKTNNIDKDFIKNGTILLLGKFDVFHIGHKALLDYAKNKAKKNNLKLGIFFINNDEKEFLQSFENRINNFYDLCFDFVIYTYFDFEFKNIDGSDFIKYLDKNFNVVEYVVGEDFRFGKDGLYGSKDIKNITNTNVNIIEIYKKNKTKISSSTIKRMHEFGEYNLINQLVVNPLVFDIEFQEKNIKWNNKINPPHFGNYYCKILIEGFWYMGIINFSINKKINYHLINWNNEKNILNQKSKLKIIDIERIIINSKYDLINENDIKNTKDFFSTK